MRAVYDPESMEVAVLGATQADRWLQAKIDPAIDPEVTAAIQAEADNGATDEIRANMPCELALNREQDLLAQWFSDWLPNVLWLLMPLYAAGLAPLFGRRRLFLEHVIFAMWPMPSASC